MADIKQIEVDGNVYDIKDEVAREAIDELTSGLGAMFDNFIDVLFPVGSIYLSVNNTAPFTRGTWSQIAAGRALVGVDSTNTLMDTVEETFGQADAVLPEHNHGGASGAWSGSANTSTAGSHSHGYYGSEFEESGSGTHHYQVNTHGSVFYTFAAGAHYHSLTVPSHTHTIASAGESAVNKNYQPSIAVYVWKRVA